MEVEAAFAARLGYDRATDTVHLSDATDAFVSTVLAALQRHYTRRSLRLSLRTPFLGCGQEQVSDDIPALQLWPEGGIHGLKHACLTNKQVQGGFAVVLLEDVYNLALYTDREIVPVLTLTAPTGPAAPSQCPFRVRTGHPIIA